MSSGGNKVVDLWRDQKLGQGQSETSREELANPYAYSDDEDEIARPGRWRAPVARAVCIGGALIWLTALGLANYQQFVAGGVTLDNILSLVSLAATPLLLLAVLWMLIQRSAGAEVDSFAQTTQALRIESQKIEELLAFVTARIDSSRRDLAEQSDSLLSLGEDAAQRVDAVTGVMRKEVESVANHAQTLKSAAAAARGDLAVLLSHLPKTQVQMRQITQLMAETGDHATRNARDLAEELISLRTVSEAASEMADGTAVFLGEQIERMHELTAEMATMIADTQLALGEAGNASADMVANRVIEIGSEINRIAGVFTAQQSASTELVTQLGADFDLVEARLTQFGASAVGQVETLGPAVAGLQTQVDQLHHAVGQGTAAVETMSGRAEALVGHLEIAARQVDDVIPQALDRLADKSGETLRAIDATVPALTEAAQSAEAALVNMREAETSIASQKQTIDEIVRTSAGHVEATRATAQDIAALVSQTATEAQALADGAGPALIDALLRIRETSRAAVEHSRAAFADFIPKSAADLGEQSKAALSDALTTEVEAQMSKIAETTERAVAAAQAATDRLMRQMLTISETSAALESRIADAKEEAETADHSNFARRVALLIESLNSTAIDVTKILSNEVTDTAWAAYLRGDRGIFSRRAVRLLDTSEAKELARHYQDDSEFREQVNRYIHDYEAMLRNVMSTRDGAPLSVALLSSDTGKLYVALAQAIERLRS